MNSSLPPYETFLAEPSKAYYDLSVLEDICWDDFVDFSAASSGPSLDTFASPASIPQADAHSLDVVGQEQDCFQGPMVPTEMAGMGIYAYPNIVPYAATQAEALWTESISPMPAVCTPTLFPPYDPTSSSLFGALGEAPSVPASSQDAMSLTGSLLELELYSFGAVAPATTEASPADASLPPTPELQYSSSSSSPSTPSSSSESSGSSDYAPSPWTKRASLPKPAKSSARRNAKPYARTSPYSSAPSSPSGSTSGLASPHGGAVRTASIKYTARRSRPGTDDAAPGPQTGKGPWGCPHCGHEPTNHSKSDLKRHITSHYLQKLVCRGERVDLLDADSLADALARHGAPWEHEGRLYVGGCWKAMARRETLIRHLINPNMGCIVPLHLHEKVHEAKSQDSGKSKGKSKSTATRAASARSARQ